MLQERLKEELKEGQQQQVVTEETFYYSGDAVVEVVILEASGFEGE